MTHTTEKRPLEGDFIQISGLILTATTRVLPKYENCNAYSKHGMKVGTLDLP